MCLNLHAGLYNYFICMHVYHWQTKRRSAGLQLSLGVILKGAFARANLVSVGKKV